MKHVILAAAIGVALIAGPAAAHAVTPEDAFNLCVAQPLMQSSEIADMVHDMLQRPHPPVFDTMSEESIVNAAKYQGAVKCAGFLSSHSDVYRELALQTLGDDIDKENAWVAYNSHCKPSPTAACIHGEVEAARAVREGPEDARSKCVLRDMDRTFIQWKKCMDKVEQPSKR